MNLRFLIPVLLSSVIAACGGDTETKEPASNPQEDSNWVTISANTDDSYIAVKFDDGAWQQINASSNVGFKRNTIKKLSVVKFCNLSTPLDDESLKVKQETYDNVMDHHALFNNPTLDVSCDNTTTFTLKLPESVRPYRAVITDGSNDFFGLTATYDGFWNEEENSITLKTLRRSGTISLSVLLSLPNGGEFIDNGGYHKYEFNLIDHPVTENTIEVALEDLTTPTMVDLDEAKFSHYFTGVINSSLCMRDDVEAPYFRLCWKPKTSGLYAQERSLQIEQDGPSIEHTEYVYSQTSSVNVDFDADPVHLPNDKISVLFSLNGAAVSLPSTRYVSGGSGTPKVRQIDVNFNNPVISIQTFGDYSVSDLPTLEFPRKNLLPNLPADVFDVWGDITPEYGNVVLIQGTHAYPQNGSSFFVRPLD